MSICQTTQVGRALNLSSNAVRKTFIDFFCLENRHHFVRSSPVLPHNDPTLAFANAGMNQFKSVLLGTTQPPSVRVANSQKCVRVGGKHNDLAHVGRDGSHHTFFEMLGNWSFGDYFKEQSCLLSWELLTKIYGLNPKRLHITYFGGDVSCGLEPDLETRDIWLQIGVPKERVQPGSMKDNFWEMGQTGPCGGCSEIHYDFDGTLLELWNLVFVEYNRLSDGSLEKLNIHHVDTGMGLERLVSVLQGKSSNYETDLFTPLFDVIQKFSKRPAYEGKYGNDDVNGIDTAYRILADHIRMITVCLSDGFFPDQEGKLRGVLRKALTIGKEMFGGEEDLLKDMSFTVAEILNDAYPEIGQRLKRVHHIIDQESELLRSLRKQTLNNWRNRCETNSALSELNVEECPSLLKAYDWLKEELQSVSQGQAVEPAVALKMCESFGVPPELAKQVAKALGMSLDFEALETEIVNSKLQSKREIYGVECSLKKLSPTLVKQLEVAGVERTRDYYKYWYRFGYDQELDFPDQPTSVVGLVVDGCLVDHVPMELFLCGNSIGVIVDRTNMYSEEGGQASDSGILTIEGQMNLEVYDVTNTSGYLVHWARCLNPMAEGLNVHNIGVIKVDKEKRMGSMRNHTATHLLNAALSQTLTIAEQKSSRVSSNKLSFDFSVYRESLTMADIVNIEQTVQNIIRHNVSVLRKAVPANQLVTIDSLTTIPGETYLHPIVFIIEINSGFILSREPCCGTHVNYTSQIEDFIITGYNSMSTGVKSIRAVTGPKATEARKNSSEFWSQYSNLETCVNKIVAKPQFSESEVENCDKKLSDLQKTIRSTELVDYKSEVSMSNKIADLRTKLKYNARGSLRSSLESEMRDVVDNNSSNYLVHYLQCSSTLDNVPLQKASNLCPYKPSLIFAKSDGVIKARCYVPQIFHTEKFSAQLWLGHVCEILKASGFPPRGQNPNLVYNMRGIKLTDTQLRNAIEIAKEFAESTM